jgi:hypothetical protein
MILKAIRLISAAVIGVAIDVTLARWTTLDAGGWALIDKQRAAHQGFGCDFLGNEIFNAMRGTRFDIWLHSPQMWHGLGVMVAITLLVWGGIVLLESHLEESKS